MDKDKKEDVKITAIEESEKGLAVAIIIDAVFSSNEKKIMKEHSIISWRFSEIDEWVNKCRKNSKIDDFVIRLLKESGVIEEDGNRVRFGNNPVVTIRCEGDVHNNIIPMVKIFCELTGGFNVVNFSDMPLESYRLDYLGLPSNTTINLTQGIAPLNSDPKKVKIKNKTKLYNIKLKNLESKNGILFRRNYKIDENDPFLNDMMDE